MTATAERTAPSVDTMRVTFRLEAAARKAANRILDIHHPERTAPVPLQLILLDAGYRVVRKKDAVNITAFYLRDAERHQLIGLNSRANPRSQQFALAHAMAHGELHDEDLLVCVEARPLRSERRLRGVRSHATAAMERQAHLYAIELLLPAAAITEAVDGFFGDEEQPRRDNLVKHVATAFEVPEAAAAFRLIDLGILAP